MLSVGLAQYLCVVVIITFHEFGHAWMASRCGDDTARHEGRVTLNPLAHIDPIGTVLIPLLVLWLAMSGQGKLASFIIGWGRPVPVNPFNLRHRVRDDILVSMAGPAMKIGIGIGALNTDLETWLDWLVEAAKSVSTAQGGAGLSSRPPAAPSAGAKPRPRSKR